MKNGSNDGRGRRPSSSFEQRRKGSASSRQKPAALGELQKTPSEDFAVAGRNAVMEALKSGESLDTLFVAREETGGSLGAIIAMAKEKGCPVKQADSKKLDSLSGGVHHQGVVLTRSAVSYSEVSDILALAEERGEAPFLIIADGIEDPHNLGALIRTAETAGAHGVVIPQRRNVGLTAAVYKTSAGALAYVKVARVVNLAALVDELKEKNIWVYGCDMEGQNWCQTDFSGGVALIVGSEGKGMSRLLREKCDAVVSLPMAGNLTSLNASVAGGIIMYEVARQRMGLSAFNGGK